MDRNYPAFQPDWVSPPGNTISDVLEERGWQQREFAERLGYTQKHVSQLITGKVPITVDAAKRLERVLGSGMEFWLALEMNYQTQQNRLEQQALLASWGSWLTELPVRELMTLGVLSDRSLSAANRAANVEECLRFFGVASPDEWRAHYGGVRLAFRRTGHADADLGALTSWLRLGEREAERQHCAKYDGGLFISALERIRRLTSRTPTEVSAHIKKYLLQSGVCFVLAPALRNVRVHGVARWLGSVRPLIQMSPNHADPEAFWFTFFHEAAHILLHGTDRTDRTTVYLDDIHGSRPTSRQELEADEWARRWLAE